MANVVVAEAVVAVVVVVVVVVVVLVVVIVVVLVVVVVVFGVVVVELPLLKKSKMAENVLGGASVTSSFPNQFPNIGDPREK